MHPESASWPVMMSWQVKKQIPVNRQIVHGGHITEETPSSNGPIGVLGTGLGHPVRQCSCERKQNNDEWVCRILHGCVMLVSFLPDRDVAGIEVMDKSLALESRLHRRDWTGPSHGMICAGPLFRGVVYVALATAAKACLKDKFLTDSLS